MQRWRHVLPVLATIHLLVAAPSAADGKGTPSPWATPVAELPPALPWEGESLALALPPDSEDPWITPAEAAGLIRTPTYAETTAWLKRLAAAAEEISLVSIGRSGEGRDLWMVIASASGAATPEAVAKSGKPVVLFQGGIHSGEIDGKDAGLMLLRNLSVGGTLRPLLDRVEVLFVPIFNVDGHERRSALGRINQRGPEEMGWRTNARNLNLNRDYAKADSPEMQAMVQALVTWAPDLYVDLHVTDGIDYQYDITWGYGGEHTYSPSISRWLSSVFDPPVQQALEDKGHCPGYLVFAVDGNNPDASLFKWTAASQRYSDGYGSARHLPTILVENHSLKPYPQRVMGTYVLLEAILVTVGEHHESLTRAITEDRARRSSEVILSWRVPRDQAPEQVEFLGVTWRHRPSEITGIDQVEWLGEPVTKTLPRVESTEPVLRVQRPAAYWIPAAWNDVIHRLELHGVGMERIDSARTVEVDLYRMDGTHLAAEPFEGRVRVELEHPPTIERRRQVFPPGSVRVPTDQALGDLAVLLLEPEAPDSFYRWGFFHGIASRTEYVEGYVMEPLAKKMLAADPELRVEFEKALADDPEFAASPRARLQWFYRRTAFIDDRWQIYPIGREVTTHDKLDE